MSCGGRAVIEMRSESGCFCCIGDIRGYSGGSTFVETGFDGVPSTVVNIVDESLSRFCFGIDDTAAPHTAAVSTGSQPPIDLQSE